MLFQSAASALVAIRDAGFGPRPASCWVGGLRRRPHVRGGGGHRAESQAAQKLSLPLSLTDAAVDPFPKQVRVAAVAGVFLNHVDQDRAQRRAAAVRLDALNA